MLSQRIVKLYALASSGVTPPDMLGMYADSVAQVDSNLVILDRSLSKATFGDLFGTVSKSWLQLKAALKPQPAPMRLAEVDRCAELLLEHAETLTANLEIAAYATALHPINVAGRQRMLTQRLAKEVLIGALAPAASAEAGALERGATWRDLVSGLDYPRPATAQQRRHRP